MTTENMKIYGRWPHSAREATLWLAIVSILVAAIGFSWNPTPFAHALAAIFIACAIVHAGCFYGSRPAFVLFVICTAITFAIANIGVASGFPFGHYHSQSTPVFLASVAFRSSSDRCGSARATFRGLSPQLFSMAPIDDSIDH